MTFSKLKALLRKAAKHTVEGLWFAMWRLIEANKVSTCREVSLSQWGDDRFGDVTAIMISLMFTPLFG